MPTTERTRARPAAAVSTPALTRHLVFYFPDRELVEGDSDALDEREPYKQLKRYVNSLIQIVGKDAAGLHYDTPEDLTRLLDKCLHEHISFGFSCGKFLALDLRILIAPYQEYFTITYTLDNNTDVDAESCLFNMNYLENVDDIARKILEGLQALARDNAGNHKTDEYCFAPTTPATITYEFLNDIVYREVWVALDLKLKNNTFLPAKLFVEIMKEDSRGLIVATDPTKNLVPEKDVFSTIQRTHHRDLPKDKKPCVMTYFSSQHEWFKETLCMEKYTHLVFGDQPSMAWDQNSVVCFVSGRMAIYGSVLYFQQLDRQKGGLRTKLKMYYDERKNALQAKTQESVAECEARMVRIEDNMRECIVSKKYDYRRYFLISDGTNEMSVGRVVRRLHVLSELRCIALVERHRIVTLHDALRLIGENLSDIIDKMVNYDNRILDVKRLDHVIEGYNKMGRGSYVPNAANGMRVYNVRDEEYVSTNKEKTRAELYEKTNGGLLYRINRSKYYYEQFLTRLEDLRDERIRGFQPYRRFVQRNYHQMVESIKSVGERYVALGVRVDRAITIAHTLQQRKMTQYALLATIVLSIFSALSALGNYISSTQIVDRSRAYWYGFGVLLMVVVDTYLFGRRYLRKRRLDVENVVDDDTTIRWFGVVISVEAVALAAAYFLLYGYVP